MNYEQAHKIVKTITVDAEAAQDAVYELRRQYETNPTTKLAHELNEATQRATAWSNALSLAMLVRMRCWYAAQHK